MDAACKQALKQIEDKDYIAKLKQEWNAKISLNMVLLVIRKTVKVMIYEE